MRKSDAIAHFGSQAKFARAINRAQSTVSGYDEILPLEIAFLTERLTDGDLKVDLKQYPNAPEALRP